MGQPTNPGPTATAAIPSDTGNTNMNWADVVPLVGLLVSVAALIGGGIGYWLAYRQTAVIERSYDRQAGKIPAKLEVIRPTNTPKDQVPPDQRFKIADAQGGARFSALDQLVLFSPAVEFRNTGDEPIEAIQIEVRCIRSTVDRKGVAPDTSPFNYILKQGDRQTHTLHRILRPGEKAGVSILKGVLTQLVQAQPPEDQLQTRVVSGWFLVTVSARLVGVPAFNAAEGKNPYVFELNWVPSGFPAEQVKKVADSLESQVIVQPKD
jgi:hypothetical protein